VNDPTMGQFYRRGLILTALLVLVVFIVVWQLVSLQFEGSIAAETDEAPVTEGVATPTLAPDAEFAPVRGNIYDCHGYLLAAASTLYDLGATPGMGDVEVLADRLAALLDMSRDDILELLNSEGSYVRLKRRVSPAEVDTVRGWGVAGLSVDPWPSRVYPNKELAASVLGFAADDAKGYYGVEGYYDETLAGESGFRDTDYDDLGCLFLRVRPPRDGADIFLTLDRNIQSVVEDALAAAVGENEAERGHVIVMDPSTGAILAMATYPSYDPNDFVEVDDELFVNPMVSDHYEPGSVFKVVTMASALDAGIVSGSTTYYDSGQIVVGGEKMKNSDGNAHGQTSMADLLALSLNVGAAHLSTSLGAYKFYDYLHRFGFNQPTNVDLAYEVTGQLRIPGDRDWHESDLGTNSFGQGLAVTPLQMICAVSAVANNGLLMQPHVMDRVVDGGQVTEYEVKAVRQVISPEAAAQTTAMLVHAVDTVLTTAAIEGYRVAGKSGTSEIPVMGTYDPLETIASFAGYVPADEPRFSMLVIIDRPQKDHWGITVAGPVFRKIAREVLTLLAVPVDSVRASLQ